MLEEFHGIWNGTATTAYKLLYGWGTLNVNVWLPSLSELVGIDQNAYADYSGCYASAMQGINASMDYWTDNQGGSQFAYFQQYNAAGGGTRIWNICDQQISWLRSTNFGVNTLSWIISGLNMFSSYDAFPLTASHAVHPAEDGLIENKFVLLRKEGEKKSKKERKSKSFVLFFPIPSKIKDNTERSWG